MKCTIVAAALALTWTGTALAQGLYWESKITGGPRGEQTSQSYAMPKKFKTTRENGSTIMRVDKEVLWQLRDKERTYTAMTFADLEQMGRKSNAMMEKAKADMEHQLASLPPEQRESMRKMMANMPSAAAGSDAPAEVKATGEKKTINGFACSKYIIDSGGNQQAVVWATKDVKDFEAMRKDWEEFNKRMMAMTPRGNNSLGAAFAKIDGFAIQTEMGPGITTTVTKVEQRAIADSEFEVPSGYSLEKNTLLEDMDGAHQRPKPKRN